MSLYCVRMKKSICSVLAILLLAVSSSCAATTNRQQEAPINTSEPTVGTQPTETGGIDIKYNLFLKAFLLVEMRTKEQFEKYSPSKNYVIQTEADWQAYQDFYIPDIKNISEPDFSKYDLLAIFLSSPQWVRAAEWSINKCYIKDHTISIDAIDPLKPVYAQSATGDNVQIYFIIVKISKNDVTPDIKNIYRKNLYFDGR